MRKHRPASTADWATFGRFLSLIQLFVQSACPPPPRRTAIPTPPRRRSTTSRTGATPGERAHARHLRRRAGTEREKMLADRPHDGGDEPQADGAAGQIQSESAAIQACRTSPRWPFPITTATSSWTR
jgi:hypothetical protein